VHLLEYALQLLPGATMVEVSGFASSGYWVKRAGEFKLWHRDADRGRSATDRADERGVAIDLTVTHLDPVGTAGHVEVVGTMATTT
jgi:hypothetical protein